MKLVITVAGDTVECGAFKGASSYLICRRIVGLEKCIMYSIHLRDYQCLARKTALTDRRWHGCQ